MQKRERKMGKLMFTLILGFCSMASAVSVDDVRLSRYELELWNSSDFQRRFAESYLAETDIEPTVSPAEREKMLKVLELISAENMDEAIALLQKNITPTSSAVFDFTLANIYFQQEEMDKASASYQEAVNKFEKFRRAWKNLGLIYVRSGDFEEAIPALTKVIELGGNDVLTYGLLGFAYSSTDNHLSAETAYRAAILLDAHTLDWKMGLARSLFKQQRYGEAVSLCDLLITEFPNRADLWLLQANAYIGLNQSDKAAINYEMVDRLGESTVDSLNMLGDIYVNQELYGTGVNAYVRAIEANPHRNPDRALRAAKVLTARGALAETKSLIQSIKDLQSNYLGTQDKKDLLKLEARIAVAEGAGDDEVKILEEIVELDPLDGDALILLGQYYHRHGDLEKAVFYFERAEGVEGFEADAKIRHGQLLVSQGKYKDALPLLRRGNELKPRDDVQKYIEQVERVSKSQ